MKRVIAPVPVCPQERGTSAEWAALSRAAPFRVGDNGNHIQCVDEPLGCEQEARRRDPRL